MHESGFTKNGKRNMSKDLTRMSMKLPGQSWALVQGLWLAENIQEELAPIQTNDIISVLVNY